MGWLEASGSLYITIYFLEKELLYKITRDFIDPPTSVSFEEPTDVLVKKYASVGSAYQIFRSELSESDEISFINSFVTEVG